MPTIKRVTTIVFAVAMLVWIVALLLVPVVLLTKGIEPAKPMVRLESNHSQSGARKNPNSFPLTSSQPIAGSVVAECYVTGFTHATVDSWVVPAWKVRSRRNIIVSPLGSDGCHEFILRSMEQFWMRMPPFMLQ